MRDTDAESERNTIADRDGDSDSYGKRDLDRNTAAHTNRDAMRDSVFAELRRSSTASVAGGLGGDQCTGKRAAVGHLSDNA